jgi:hypothetical protein
LYTNELIGNVIVNGTVNLSSNLQATYFIGNGSQLTGLDQAALPNTGHMDLVGNMMGDHANIGTLAVSQTSYFTGQVNVIGNMSTQGMIYGSALNTTGNVSAAYFLGNGALLTDIVATLPDVITADVLGNVTATGNVSATNVTATNFYGDGSSLTGVLHEIPSDLTVSSLTATNIYGDGSSLTGVLHEIPSDLTVSSLTATNIYGDGSSLTGVLHEIPSDLTVSSLTATNIYGDGSSLTGVLHEIPSDLTVSSLTATNIYGDGSSLTGVLHEIPSDLSVNTLSASGNVSAGYFIGNGALLTGIVSDISGNLNVQNIHVVGNVDVSNNVNVAGNVITGKLFTSDAYIGNIYSGRIESGNLYANQFFFGNGAFITGIPQYELPGEIAADVLGNVTATGNVSAEYFLGNGALLTGIEQYVLPSEITADVLGNVTATGNVSAEYFLGNGALLSGIEQYVLPSEITADVLGNVTATGSVAAPVHRVDDTFYMQLQANNAILAFDANDYLEYSRSLNKLDVNIAGNTVATFDSQGNLNVRSNVIAPFFLGNGALLSGITTSVSGNLNVTSVTATGNVSANTINVSRDVNAYTGNVNALRLYTPQAIVGNLTATYDVISEGNVSGTYILGNGALLSGIEQYVLPSQISADVLGNVTATGNVQANYFIGNGFNLVLDGYTLKPTGNVANEAARLALPAQVGTIVNQTDINQEYLLLATPANVDSNWLEFTGANYPVTSVFGRTGAVVLLSGTDVNTIGGTSIVGNGDITSLAVDINGNVTATGDVYTSGNVSAWNVYASSFSGDGATFTGDGTSLTGVLHEIPSEITADVFGNVTATGNVSAEYFLGNGALLSGIEQYVLPSEITADVLGNVTATGNVSAEYFLGNGALLSGIEQYVLPSEITADVLGNVTATGNVSAAYFLGNGALLTGIEQYVLPSEITADVFGNVTATGNVSAEYFLGNGALLTGIEQYVLPSEITADVFGNVTATGNVSAEYFLGNGALLTGIEQYVLPSEITADVLGNVTATGNVSAEYFLGNGALLTGIEQYVLPSEITADVFGNVTATGNVDVMNFNATNYYGDGTSLTGVLHSLPNDVEFSNVGVDNLNATNVAASNVIVNGNVSAEYFLGNGALLTGIEQYVLPSEITADVLGNVTATGNVSAEYVLGNGAFLSGIVVSGNLDVSSVTVSGNVEAAYFVGNGSMLTDVAVLNENGMIQQTNLDGYLTVPQGYVANAAVRLALGGGALPIGSLARQVDDGNSYLLTLQPSNVDANWLQFTGLNFPVSTVFGRIGDVLAAYGDYMDGDIELTANVGPVPAGNAVSEALEYLNGQVQAIWNYIL